MARINNTKETKNTSKRTQNSQKNAKKTSEKVKNDEKKEVEIPKVSIKRTRLGRPPRVKTKDLIAAAYEYMNAVAVPSITEFALQQGYEREYLYERAEIEKNKGKPELSYTIKMISQCKEVKLEKLAVTGLCPPNYAIFALKQLGWTDKVESKVEADVDSPGGLMYIAPRLDSNEQ